MNAESNPQMTLEEYERIAERIQAERRHAGLAARYRVADERWLLWASFAPYWTAELADRAGFSAEALERMREAGLVRVTQARTPDGSGLEPPVYTIKDSVRSGVIEERATGQEAVAEARRVVAEIGRNMQAALASGAPAPASLRRWATLAAHADNSAALVETFNQNLERSRQQTAEIVDWKNTARQLSNLLLRGLDDSLNQALQRATRLLELARRKENDEQHLRYFKARTEQRLAFEQLMRGPDDRWAMHLIGAGGVGKTMLVRQIMAHWAGDEQAVTARIDFDYLSADYPSLAPGILLWAFAQDLRAHAGESATNLFNQADLILNRLSQELRFQSTRGQSAPATAHQSFHAAVELYIAALRLIPGRVLLIADTCEELTKGSSGLARQNVSETFRILTALHDGPQTLAGEPPSESRGLPNLRVIFSGRRPLARRGDSWSCPAASALDERPFLRLHEIRGFTKDDAREFLRVTMKVPPQLVEAIVTRSSADAGSVSAIEYDDPSDRPSQVQRCNPYDLRLYAEWAKDEPPPEADEILHASGARYVELRIINRLDSQAVEAVLPAVALLGHFDLECLQKIYPDKSAEVIDEAFERLQVEEWINQRTAPGPDGRTSRLILDVETGLRERLLTYFRQQSSSLERVQRRAADHMEELTLRRDLTELDWSYFDAALRVLEADPDRLRAARWWKEVEQRIVSERPPEWVRAITTGLQSEGSRAAQRDPDGPPDTPPESHLRPAILALHVAAQLNTALRSRRPGELGHAWREAAEVWKEVAAKAHLHTLPDEARKLEIRALAGSITSALATGAAVETESLYQFRTMLKAGAGWYMSDAHVTLALVAAFEALIESAEQAQSAGSGTVQDLLAALYGVRQFILPPGLRPAEVAARSGLTRVSEGVVADAKRDTPDCSSSDDSDDSTDGDLPEDFRLLQAYVDCLVGRLYKLQNNHDEARRWFAAALSASPEHRPTLKAIWGDWAPPDDITARIRLEFVRAAYPALMSAAEVLKEVGRWEIKLYSVDSERLHAALVMLELALVLVPSRRMSVFDITDSSKGRLVTPIQRNLTPGPETCNAHRATPPLFVAAAEVLAANGQADEALTLLGLAVKDSSLYTLDTLLHAERAGARIIWRMRMQNVGEKPGEGLAASTDIEDLSLIWTLDALEGQKSRGTPPQPSSQFWSTLDSGLAESPGGSQPTLDSFLLEGLDELSNPVAEEGAKTGERRLPNLFALRRALAWTHAVWETRYALELSRAEETLGWASSHLHPDIYAEVLSIIESSRSEQGEYRWPPTMTGSRDDVAELRFLLASALIDAENARQLFTSDLRLPVGLQSPAIGAKPSFTYRDFSRTFADYPERQLTLILRIISAGYETVLMLENHQMLARLGMRRAAEIAWREGELLALRLPQRAARVLVYARDWFEACDDLVGVIVSGTSLYMLKDLDKEPGWIADNMSKVESAYDTLRERWNETQEKLLPSLEELDKLAAEAQETTSLSDWAPRCWQPWLVRLMLCRRLMKEGGDWQAEQSRRLVKRYLGLACGTAAADGKELLPADLAAWTDRPPPPRTPWQVIRQGLSIVWKIVSPLLGLALALAFIVIGISFIYTWFMKLSGYVIDTGEMSTGWRLGFFGVFMVWVMTAFNLFRSVKRAKPDALSTSLWGRRFTTYPLGKFIPGVIGILVLSASLAYYFQHYSPALKLTEDSLGWQLLWAFTWGTIATLALFVIFFPLRLLEPLMQRYMSNVDRRMYEGKLLPLFKVEVTPTAAGVEKGEAQVSLSLGKANTATLLYASILTLFATIRYPSAREYVSKWKANYQLSEAESYAALFEKPWPDDDDLKKLLKVPVWYPTGFGLWREASIEIVDGPLNGPCWEAIFVQTSLDPAERQKASRLRFYRTVSNAPHRVAKFNPNSNTIVALTEGVLSDNVAGDGWKPLTNTASFPLQRLRYVNVILASSELMMNTRILHLIGAAEETAVGIKFRVGEDAAAQLTSQTVSGTMSEGGDLFGARDLTLSFYELALCVLQGNPGPPRERTGADRRAAVQARVFASKLFAQGVPAVLFIPSVEPKLAAELISMLADYLAGRQSALLKNPAAVLDTLPRLVAGMRKRIAAAIPAESLGGESPEQSLMELMLDVCLYVHR